MKSVRLALAATAALVAVPAFAQPPATGTTPPPATGAAPPPAMSFPMSRASTQQSVEQRFATRDTNHDGFLTSDELGGAATMILGRLDGDHDGKVSQSEAVTRTLADFDRVDANHDGSVTEAEAAAMTSASTPAAPPAASQPHGH